MLTTIHPKLPMRNKELTKVFYEKSLNFIIVGEYDDYLIVAKDQIEIHFFLFENLNPKENYGQVYIRTDDINMLYRLVLENKVNIHPNAPLQTKPWGQKEFSLLDPDRNLLTFGEKILND